MGSRIPIKGDLLGYAALLNCLLQEPLRGGDIAVFTQEKVDGLSLGVDSSIEIGPLAFDLNVGFVDAPRRTHGPGKALPAFCKLWDIPLHPPHNGRVSQIDMPLR